MRLEFGENLPAKIRSAIRALEFPGLVDKQLFAVFSCVNTARPVIIPCAEIFRHFFARSPFLVRHILDGTILDADALLWNTALTSPQPQPGCEIVWLKAPPNTWDIPFVARFAFSPWARRQAEEVLLWIACQQDLREMSLRAIPPLKGVVSLDLKLDCLNLDNDAVVAKSIIWAIQGNEHRRSAYPFGTLTSKYHDEMLRFPSESLDDRALVGRRQWPAQIQVFPD